MGCDGGTIPTRGELVSLKKKPEKNIHSEMPFQIEQRPNRKDKNSVLNTKWKLCNISLDPLKQPIVACQLGNIFNKESILELLLDRAKIDKVGKFNHIRSLKDITTLNLTSNPGYEESKVTSETYIDHQASEYICNVSGLEMNGRHRFSFLIGCGCVISERALTQVKSNACHKCGKPFDLIKDVVVLLGGTGDLNSMAEKMVARKLIAKQEKKTKRKLKEIEDAKFKCPIPLKTSRLDITKAIPSTSELYKKKQHRKNDVEIDSSNKKDIQSDESTTKVYKSIFNTCEDAKNRKTGNWEARAS